MTVPCCVAVLMLCSGSLLAQVDLSGAWAPDRHEDATERGPGPDLVDYLGLPINDFARQWALAWAPDRLGLQEHQCQVHTAAYIHRGPLRLRIWEERDEQTQNIVAIHMYSSTYEQNRVIFMDGRPHPAEYAPHTWMGFSTGRWDGNVLTVTTTHIKQGWHRRNGLPSSDRITLLEHFIRHGDGLTHVSIVTDPDYLTEPLIKSDDYSAVADSQGNWLWPCEYVNELPGHARDRVPSFLPGTNPFLKEFAEKHSLTQRDVLGGAETMYPEFRDQRK
ncbi:MAG: hypothetical protein RL328_1521 [Acidobacteriota bacterium]